LTGWEHRSFSSIRITGAPCGTWTAFRETWNSEGDDTLLVGGSGEFANLLTVRRPHGNNNWNDRISQIIFNRGPVPNNRSDNYTVFPSGSRTYNVGNGETDQLDTSNPNWGSC
jgi:hypothetical protein